VSFDRSAFLCQHAILDHFTQASITLSQLGGPDGIGDMDDKVFLFSSGGATLNVERLGQCGPKLFLPRVEYLKEAVAAGIGLGAIE